MSSIRSVRDEIAQRLLNMYEESEALNIAGLLLEDVFEVDRLDFFAGKEILIDRNRLEGYVQRLIGGEPIQYVTGVAHFFGRNFHIRKGALIPRPETEELVKLILDENKVEQPKVLDVGTGSGCIAISLAMELKIGVLATDISEAAIEIAKKNAGVLNAPAEFINHNILDSFPPVENLDILVSNPPYIPESERGVMHRNVLEFEPPESLFVSDDDPLIFYRKISEAGLSILKPGGKLYFEIHEYLADETIDLIREKGYTSAVVHQDMQGKPRMISAINSTSR